MRIGRLYLLHKFTVAPHPELGPLLIRYAIVKCPWFAVCIHKLCRSDHDRALHDHPWAFISLVLKGGYLEVTDNELPGWDTLPLGEPRRTIHRCTGSVAYRPASWRHRVVIENGRPAWTLILIGPRVRHWGFWIREHGVRGVLGEHRWCWWRKHNAELNVCEDEPIHVDGED